MSHWRTNLPEGLIQAWQIMQQGQTLVQATSTKYTLVTKIDVEEGSKLAKDLLRGCEYMGTAALVVHDDALGCSPSLRHSVKQGVRGVVQTCIQLLQVFQDGSSHKTDPAPAQKTGAVWDACEKVQKLPQNNRNAIRRDLMVYRMECQETLQEFTELLQVHHSDDTQETTFEMFSSGQSDDYSPEEEPIAASALTLVKCSRGTMNVVLQACESIGEALTADNHHDLLGFLAELHRLARRVGEGMTDLGTLLYPPLELDDLSEEIKSQSNAIVELHALVLDGGLVEFPQDLLQTSTNIRSAAQRRAEEALKGISRLSDSS
jgi:hypothetical protein